MVRLCSLPVIQMLKKHSTRNECNKDVTISLVSIPFGKMELTILLHVPFADMQ